MFDRPYHRNNNGNGNGNGVGNGNGNTTAVVNPGTTEPARKSASTSNHNSFSNPQSLVKSSDDLHLQIERLLSQADENLSDALAEQQLALQTYTNGNGSGLPRIHINHDRMGKHSIYLNWGDDLDGELMEPFTDNQFECCIFSFQSIRAYWGDDLMPICSAIEDRPTVSEPVSASCKGCSMNKAGTECKAKIRLFMLLFRDHGHETELIPAVMSIPATSIKYFQKYLNRAQRSGVPIFTLKTHIGIEDVKKNGWRWAVATFDFAGVVDNEHFPRIIEARREYKRYYDELKINEEFKDYMQKTDETIHQEADPIQQTKNGQGYAMPSAHFSGRNHPTIVEEDGPLPF